MTWTEPAYEAVARLVSQRAGLSLNPTWQTGEEGIRRAMVRAGVHDLGKYLALLQDNPDAFDDLMVELTVGETYFFREPAQFQFIRRQVLPEIQQRRGPDHMIRAWSAACATGEEVYSLAILFQEEGLGERAHLLATDISRKALAQARQAIYGDWSLRDAGATLALPYLAPLQPSLVRGRSKGVKNYQLHQALRQRVRFDHLNLALDVYPSFANGTWGMDLILCRNVLIYFDRATTAKVAGRLFETLAEGGWLITASSDPPLGEAAPFQTVATEVGVFYRRPLAPSHQPFPLPEQEKPLPKELFFPDTEPWPLEEIQERYAPAPTVAPVEPAVTQPGSPDQARHAYQQGDYARTVLLTGDLLQDAQMAALHVRALAFLDVERAEKACAQAVLKHPLGVELSYLHGLLLLDLARKEEAVRAARRVVYLDRTLAVGHFLLGSILQQQGDGEGAVRAYRNCQALCAARPQDEMVPLGDGESLGQLGEAAAFQLSLLEAREGEPCRR